jgi:hypothetical protein
LSERFRAIELRKELRTTTVGGTSEDPVALLAKQKAGIRAWRRIRRIFQQQPRRQQRQEGERHLLWVWKERTLQVRMSFFEETGERRTEPEFGKRVERALSR